MDKNPYHAPQDRQEKPGDNPDEDLERFFDVWNLSDRENQRLGLILERTLVGSLFVAALALAVWLARR